MQSVYSFSLTKQKELKDELLFFEQSVDQFYNLYFLLLGLFKALKNQTEEQIKAYSIHKIKIDKNYNALNALSQNKILKFISSHDELKLNLKSKKFVSWELETVFLNDLLSEIFNWDEFENYIRLVSSSSKDDQRWFVKCFKEILTDSKYLFSYLEDHQLTWIDDLPVVNTFILKMLRKIDEKKPKSLKLPNKKNDKDVINFGTDLLKKTINNNEQILEDLSGKTPNWDSERIALLDQAILKTAITELLHFPSIPTKVTMNEYLEIAKDYSTPKSNNFVNGVLDVLVRDFTKNKRFVKKGRGLL
tara:strand:+ start:2513 stop:3424 length:912 start_codon:yes stop_codon:yes gene_type:complete